MISRRAFIMIAAGYLIPPDAVDAQSLGKPPKVGLLFLGAPEVKIADRAAAFREGLRERGWIEGETILLEYRYAAGDLDREYPYKQLEAMTAELAQQGVAVIVTFGQMPTWAARRVTAAIPIVMVAAENPVENSLVASLARPGGNVTGLTLTVLDQDLMRSGWNCSRRRSPRCPAWLLATIWAVTCTRCTN